MKNKTNRNMEDNKLIAEFMGAIGTPKYNPTEWDIYITGCLDVDSDDENAKHFYTPEEMKYHTSWDWLMPVVEKIEEDERYDVMILQNGTIIRDQYGVDIVNNVANISFDNKIEHTYNAIVEFIKHLNK